MKPTKLKPGKCWGLVLSETNAAEVVSGDTPQLVFKTRKEAVEYQRFFPKWDRPRLVRLEVTEI